MKVKKTPIILILFSLCFLVSNLFAQSLDQYLFKTLDLIVSRTLSAYNREDYIAFSEYFSKKTESFNKRRHFDAEFISIHKKTLGKVFNREILPLESSFDHDLPELVYKAEFKNHENVLITINFINQNDNHRITRIRFDRVYDNNKHL
jgi:hypothetical protein